MRWQGLSYREVAAKLGVTQAAVETLIFRARRSLANSLEKPVKARRRAMNSLNAGALLSSLKTLIVGNFASSVATAVAVAASATALTAATMQRGDDFPSHATPVTQVDKPKPAAPRTRLADRSLTPAVAVDLGPGSNAGGNGKGKGWKGTHPRANGKANGNAHGKDKPKDENKGQRSAHPQASNSKAPASPPGQVRSGSNGRAPRRPPPGTVRASIPSLDVSLYFV